MLEKVLSKKESWKHNLHKHQSNQNQFLVIENLHDVVLESDKDLNEPKNDKHE